MKGKSFGVGLLMVVLSAVPAAAAGGNPGGNFGASYVGQLTSDFKYVVNNGAGDAHDLLTSPLSLPQALHNPNFYLTLAGAGAAMGLAFGLDQTLRSRMRHMSSTDASHLQNFSTYGVGAATALTYAWGLYTDNERARHYMLTAGESAGVASLAVIAIKYAFGRKRPYQGKGHWAWFTNGQSFVSGDTTPVFALATGISEYAHNRWWVAVPVYSAATAVGLGRMGHDAHWFSDVLGGALIGWGTTELLLHWHKEREDHPSRFQIFSTSSPTGGGAGLGVGVNW